ncbi:hypothetical protein BHE90_016652 [Fusarium euwallaceae]|uniref:Uncharacterized protein n=2 Tax=Fusarium solani species complex TaxID=232080 RepID=A0A430KZV3_9HYPO|nr:hypothetical protein CDV31_016433 [Fusarium ambrosium]RTE68966.1 hypothetical protein BHE90_016652 [Fusarium euwallaceae]
MVPELWKLAKGNLSDVREVPRTNQKKWYWVPIPVVIGTVARRARIYTGMLCAANKFPPQNITSNTISYPQQVSRPFDQLLARKGDHSRDVHNGGGRVELAIGLKELIQAVVVRIKKSGALSVLSDRPG